MAERLQPVLSRIDALKRQLYDALTNPRDYASMLGGRIWESGQAAEQLQSQAFADPRQPFKVTDEAALRQLTDMMMAGPLGFAPAGITAYHGSPYLFKQFDPMKVGTGEGAQAYGVGAGYTAEAKDVAATYRNPGGPRTGTTPITIDNVEATQWKQNPKLSKIEQRAADAISRTRNPDYAIEYLKQDVEFDKTASDAIKWIENNRNRFGDPGYLYKGDIPDEIIPRFLNWDEPLTKDAPQEVKDSFNSILQKYPELKEPFFKAFRENKPGSHYYAILNDYAKTGDLYKNQLFASKVLEDAGIRGIRYLDQGSRGEGKGTSNFVPFRPEDFKIQEINDIPLEEYIAKGLLSP